MKGAGTATVAASMGLAGCSNPADQGEDSSGGGPIPDEPLRMACIGFTSGPASVFGTPMMQSARMVVDQINENGGILGEREIEMEEFDENVDEVVQQYRRLATREEEFDVIVGYISSANVLSIAPIAEELEQPTVVWGHGNDEPVRRRGDGSAVHLPNVCEQFDRRGRRGAVTAERAPRRRDRRRRQSGLRVRAEQLGPVPTSRRESRSTSNSSTRGSRRSRTTTTARRSARSTTRIRTSSTRVTGAVTR